MTYRSFIEEELFLVLWDSPTVTDINKVLDKVAHYRVELDRPIFFVGIIHKNTVHPDSEGRVAFANSMKKFDEHCDAFYVIGGGEGFAAAATRSIISTIMLRSHGHKKPQFVGSIREAISKTAAPEHRRLFLRVDTILKENKVEI